jgi:hypothetical protein
LRQPGKAIASFATRSLGAAKVWSEALRYIEAQTEIRDDNSPVVIYIARRQFSVGLAMKIHQSGKYVCGFAKRRRAQVKPVLLRCKSADALYWHTKFQILLGGLLCITGPAT